MAEPIFPYEWRGEEPSERTLLKIEHDRMHESEPFVVTVEIENTSTDPAPDEGGYDMHTLHCLTPEEALEAAAALTIYAWQAKAENLKEQARGDA